MAKKKAKLKLTTSNILTCLVYAAIGVLLCIFRGDSLDILMTVVGALLVVLGVIDLFKNKETGKGIIEALLGVAIIVCGWLVMDLVLLILGVVLIVKGVMEIVKNRKAGFVANLSSIMLLVIGVLLVVSKWALLDVMCLIAGIIFIINGVLALFGQSLTKRR